jgi:hypothetical protein
MGFECSVFRFSGKQTRQGAGTVSNAAGRGNTLGFEFSAFRTGARCMAFADWGSSDPRQSQLKAIRETMETAVMAMHHLGKQTRQGWEPP